MSDMMTFPDTWEEYEKSYGFTDNEKVYTNGARLIPSFRVKQWLDHLSSIHQDVPNTNIEDIISRQEAINALCAVCGNDCDKNEFVYNAPQDEQVILCPEHYCLCALPPVQPERKKGEWIRNDNGTYSCSICQSWIPEEQHYYARYCLYCGADMRGSLNV